VAVGSFNLDAWIDEQEGKPFEFTWAGESYSCPWGIDFRLVQIMAKGKPEDIEQAFVAALGRDQYVRMVSADKHLPFPAMVKLLEQYALQSGIELGESSASPGSSPKKATRSRPTSSASTGSTSAA
jgi:hypothetical protein